MSDIEIQEEFQKEQQRFEAALRFATVECDEREGGRMDYPTLYSAIGMADELLAKLEETRMKK